MENWQNESLKTVELLINGESIPIEFFIQNVDKTEAYVYAPLYRPKVLIPELDIPINFLTLQLYGYVDKDIFLDDIHMIIDYINCHNLNIKKGFPYNILVYMCEQHIKIFGRIIDVDLLIYIDELMHVLWNINIDVRINDNRLRLYNFLVNFITSSFKNYIYINNYPFAPIKMNS